jgi:tRNA-2-methylthio-N6-dimethylallyladenosine synthase
VHLLGQIVNHYQAPDDPSCDFAELLARVHGVEGLQRIRFASPHPRHVGARLVAAMRDLPRVCRHLHLPVQSGSTRILTAMRRRHTRDQYLDLVDRLRAAIPGIALSTDVIVGFPGETSADFEETLSLARQVRFSAMFSFKYSVRPNTFAARELPDDVPEPEKALRLARLQTLQREIQLEHHRGMVGRTVEVLIDGISRRSGADLQGRTTGNAVVNLPGPHDWIGRLLDVRIVGAGANSLRGQALRADTRS